MTDQFFKPEEVNDFFVGMAGLPHCTDHEYPVYNYVVNEIQKRIPAIPEKLTIVNNILTQAEWGKALPGERVIVLRRQASAGQEKATKVILQGHMDMVCVAPGGKNPSELPLNLFLDNDLGTEVLKRGGQTEETGGTLGADDGIGIATAMAIITDTTGKFLPKEHGMVECLFTVQEETNMGGALGFDLNLLQGDTFVNLDSETCNVITYGSAGGSGVDYQWVPALEDIQSGDTTASIELKGLTGGHSGVDISEGYGNAIKMMAQLLRWLREVKKLTVNLITFTAGTFSNAIPNKADVTIAFTGDFADFQSRCNDFFTARKQEYQKTDPNMNWSIQQASLTGKKLDILSTNNMVDQLLLIPTGPLKMLAEPAHVVETSTNLAIIRLDAQAQNGKITITCSNRSSSGSSLAHLEAIHKQIANLFGMRMFIDTDIKDAEEVLQEDFAMENSGMLIISGRYPGWMPNENSELLQTALTVYKEAFKDIPEAKLKEVIHAGLECGWFVQRFNEQGRNIDCIAIGPNIVSPHSWNERLEIDTLPVFVKNVTKILEKLWDKV